MKNIKQNLTLYIGLGIPLAMILFIAVLVYGGSLFNTTPPPAYNFVYATGDSVIYPSSGINTMTYPANACAKYYYVVTGSKITRVESKVQADPNFAYCKGNQQLDIPPKFYIHDVTADKSTTVTFEDLEKYTLDTSVKSRDGYELVRGSSNNDFMFFGGRNYDPSLRYLVKGNHSVKVSLQIPRDAYYGADTPLGWILK